MGCGDTVAIQPNPLEKMDEIIYLCSFIHSFFWNLANSSMFSTSYVHILWIHPLKTMEFATEYSKRYSSQILEIFCLKKLVEAIES